MSGKEAKGTEEKESRVKKAFSVVGSVLVYVFFALCLVMLLVSVVSKRSDDGAVTVFGYQLRVVVSASMDKSEYSRDVSEYKIKSFPVKTLVFTKLVPDSEEKAQKFYDGLEVGDVLTFRYSFEQNNKQVTITHRLVGKEANAGGGYILTLEGDNRAGLEKDGSKEPADVSQQIIDTSEDPGIATRYVLGKVTAKSVVFGHIVYALRQPLGMALIVIIPCALIIIVESVRIGSIIAVRKKEHADAESAGKSAEIDELKRKLAALEQASDKNEPPSGPPAGQE